MSILYNQPLGSSRRKWALAVIALSGVAFLFPLPQRTHHAGAPALLASRALAAATPDAEVPVADSDPPAHRLAAVQRLGARAWHNAGFRGRGLKVAVLDTGFCGYRAHLGKALPARVLTRSFRFDGNLEARDSQHGILCGEVIHALAPEAELLFANWEPEHPEQFLAAVRWARAEGAKIISCSVIMPTWSDCEGNGPVHRDLAALLGRDDKPGSLLCFASAGNTAHRHWSGPFRDAGNGWHAWSPGECANKISPWGGERVSVELCCRPGSACELVVNDDTMERVVGRDHPTAGRSCAVVEFTPQAGRGYSVWVRRTGGPGQDPGRFHLVVLGGGLAHHRRQGSIPFPGDGPEVIAVGAVDSHGRRRGYSSCGPNSPSPKPDLVAPVPFPSLWRQRPFAGTSAAAPQAAALAALVWSRHPNWTGAQVRREMQHAAQPLGRRGHNPQTGYGCVHLP